jgi:hypothetical protein
MKAALQNSLSNLFLPAKGVERANLLRKLLFAYVLFNAAQMAGSFSLLYGNHSAILTRDLHGLTLTTFVNLLSVSAVKSYWDLFLIVQVIFAVLGLFGFFPRLCTMAVFFTTINLQNRIYATLTGGDVLLQLQLFYLMFVSDGKSPLPLANAFDHVFFRLCQVQVLLVYLVSALYKLQSPEWLEGSALQRILLVNEYSLPGLQKLVIAFPLVFRLLTWLALCYQLLFPALVFSRRLKNYVLLGGVLFHIFIAFGMGLFNFSLVMICCYVLFYDGRTAVANQFELLR